MAKLTQLLTTRPSLSSRPSSLISTFLVPFLAQRQPPQHRRRASILSALSDCPGAHHKRIRRGRGPASGKGKTSGRGHKGQKQHGKVPAGFEGGQTPIEVVRGPRGFENQFTSEFAKLNLDRLQSWIEQGRLDATKQITIKELKQSGCVTKVKDGVKLLGNGYEDFKTPVNIVVSRASARAIEYIEKAGGKITTRFYAPMSIQKILRGLIDPVDSIMTQKSTDGEDGEKPAKTYKYRLSDPTSRKDIEYYRNPEHRGYLSYMVGEGESPSLFFKKPGGSTERRVKQKDNQANEKESNKVW